MVRGVRFALLAHAVPASAARVQLRVDPPELQVGQQAEVSVIVVDGVPETVPDVPVGSGLSIEYVDQNHGIRNVQFQVVREVVLTYHLTAIEEGRWSVGPVSVPIGEERFRSDDAEVVVTPAIPVTEQLTATAGFDHPEAWVGQVVLYRYTLRSRQAVMRSRWILPSMEGLVAPDGANRPRREDTIQDPLGTLYIDETILPFVVAKVGDLTQRPAVVSLELARSTGPGVRPTSMETVASEDSPLVGRPLPPAPPGFTGLVGDFEVTGRLSGTEAKVGGSVEWVVDIRGEGVIEGVGLPPVPEGAPVQVYEGTSSRTAEVVNGRYRAEASFTRVIVPTEAGTLQLPTVQVVVFSPELGDYVVHDVVAEPITVGGGASEGGLEAFGVKLGAWTDDSVDDAMRSVIRRGSATQTHRAWLWCAWLLAVTPGLWVVGTRWVRRRGQRGPQDDPEAQVHGAEARLGVLLAGDGLSSEHRRRCESAVSALRRARFAERPVPAEVAAEVAALLEEPL